MQRALRPFLVFALPVSALLAQVAPEQLELIKKEGLQKSQVMAHLDHLVNRIGPRLTSSDNLTVACEWACDTFKSFGIDNAHLEEWGTYQVGFNRGPWWGRVTKPEPMELVCNTDAWTAGTRGPSKGPLLMAPKNAEDLAAMTGKLRAVWLLDPPGALLKDLTEAMVKEGGFGYVAGGRDLLITGGRPLSTFDNLPALPIVRVRGDQYNALKEQLQAEKSVEVEFDIRNHFRKGPVPLFNVIADIPGTEKPDEFVVVGGHIDSWDGATGTTDNGTGTATTIEAARILMAISAKPRRSIRFMLWSGEEQGLQGSRAWVQKHKPELEKYSACLVHDGGTNYLSGIGGMQEMRPQLETVFKPVIELNPDMPFRIRDIQAFTPIGSDHESFTAAGVPGFFWGQAGKANYTHTHHTQHDTYGAAIPEYQKHSSVVIAIGALGLANLPEMLTRENMKVQSGFGGGGGGGRGGAGRGGRGGGRMLGVTLADDGVTVTALAEDGAALKAGLKTGDKLLKIGDKPIKEQADIRTALDGAGAKTTVTVKRGDKEETVTVTFAGG